MYFEAFLFGKNLNLIEVLRRCKNLSYINSICHILYIVGSTCTKSITLTIMDTILILQKDQPLIVQNQPSYAAANFKSRDYHMIKTHFYDIIHSDHGVTLIWDRGTRILVKLNPKFKGINLLTMYYLIYCFLFLIYHSFSSFAQDISYISYHCIVMTHWNIGVERA